MKHLHLFALITVLLLIAATGCRHQHVITPEQAMDAVRAFEGDSALQLVCSDLKEFTEGPDWAHQKTYDLKDIEGASRRRSWTVDAVTGEVTVASYYDTYPDDWPQHYEPLGPLTREQCLQIAEDFARSRYSGFDTMGFQVDQQEWAESGWSFGWQQKVAYDAKTPNFVSVDVNPANGDIQSYVCRRISMPAPQAPQITVEQAVDAVRIDRGLATAYDPEPYSLFATPEGMFWILIDFWGEDAQGKSYRCNARVDAMTGEVVSTSECSASEPHTEPSAPKKSPPAPAKSKQTGSTR